jgi:hypothetical protein
LDERVGIRFFTCVWGACVAVSGPWKKSILPG